MNGLIQDEIGPILAVLGLFVLGVLSPGPNFLVVAQSSMSRGGVAGLATGLGVALGDGIYATAGLLGVESFLVHGGVAMAFVRLVGGLYLMWLGAGMIMNGAGFTAKPSVGDETAALGRCFMRGLLTDLSNPKTILFFASIFAVAYVPGGPPWVPVLTLASILGFSALWRAGLSYCFSRPPVRALYEKLDASITRLCGAFLMAMGLRFVLVD